MHAMFTREAGIVVTSEPGNARIVPSSYDKIEELTNANEVLVIPGFFGVTRENQICTFSRGGSDITGSIIAAGVKADLYETLRMLMVSLQLTQELSTNHTQSLS